MIKHINSENVDYVDVTTDTLVLDDRATEGSFNAITSDAVYRAISVDPGNVPEVGSGDNGKVLTASYGEGGGSFGWASAPVPEPELPAYTASDDGKVLMVVNGSTPPDYTPVPGWASPFPSLTGNAGKVLTVSNHEYGVEWATPSGGGGGGSATFNTTFNLVKNTADSRMWVVGSGNTPVQLSAGVYAFHVMFNIQSTDASANMNGLHIVRCNGGGSIPTETVQYLEFAEENGTTYMEGDVLGILNVPYDNPMERRVYVEVFSVNDHTSPAVWATYTGSVTLYLAKL